jgi:hypothetical protein
LVVLAQISVKGQKQNKLGGRVTVIVQFREIDQRAGIRRRRGSRRGQYAAIAGTRKQQEHEIPLVVAAEETKQSVVKKRFCRLIVG